KRHSELLQQVDSIRVVRLHTLHALWRAIRQLETKISTNSSAELNLEIENERFSLRRHIEELRDEALSAEERRAVNRLLRRLRTRSQRQPRKSSKKLPSKQAFIPSPERSPRKLPNQSKQSSEDTFDAEFEGPAAGPGHHLDFLVRYCYGMGGADVVEFTLQGAPE
ncbi:MAG: hypothetical protein MHM6MM_005348, partial [Cercozoa sp. M6MM]